MEKEKYTKNNLNVEVNTDKKESNNIQDEFVEVISIHTGKVKRMRFTYELRNKKKEK